MREILVGSAVILVLASLGCTSSCSETYGDAQNTYVKVANRQIDLDFADAISRGDLEKARTLIAEGADVNASFRGEEGMTNLMLASMVPTDELVRFLLDAGADPDLQRDDGATALLVAARLGRIQNVEALLAAGADPSIADDAGLTPLSAAESEGHEAVVEVLRRQAGSE